MSVLSAGLALALLAPNCLRDPARRDDTNWWRSHCTVLIAADDDRVARAEQVFEKLKRAILSAKGVDPELLVVRDSDKLHAFKTSSADVVISERVLDLCYGDRRRSQTGDSLAGDSRLAHVLAHELEHIALRHPPGGFDAPETRDAAAQAREDMELRADAAAIIAMGAAGFEPRAVLGQSPNFLEQWAAATRAQRGPAKRVEHLRRTLASVAGALPLHEAGVLFLEAGEHERAADLFQAFLDGPQFAWADVLTDIGFARHQIALRTLHLCDRAEAVRFMLPGVIDPETLAQRMLLRGPKADCRQDRTFTGQIDPAIRSLEAALDADPDYAPARLNLIAAFVTAGRFSQAISAVEQLAPPDSRSAGNDRGCETLRAEVDRAACANLYAVAYYRWAEENGLDEARDQAVSKLGDLAKRAPRDVAVAYNRARMLTERAWERVLELNPTGAFGGAAQAARCPGVVTPAGDETGWDVAEPRLCVGENGVGSAPPVPLGALSSETRARLGAASEQVEFSGGKLRTYRGQGWSAFELADALEPDGAIKLVVEELALPLSLDAIHERLGAPRGEVPLVGGRRVLRYDGCAYEVDGAEAVRRIVFQPGR